MRKTNPLMAVSAAALVGAALVPLSAHAADPAETCVRAMSLKVSGQVNRGVLYAERDDGEDGIFVVDNDNSSSRVRWVAKGQVTCDWSIGATFEVEYESNTTADIEFDQDESALSDRFKERKIEWWAKGPLGKLSVGQGDTASNGTSEVDLSGAGVVGYSDVAPFAAGLFFIDGDATSEIGDFSTNMDGMSRRDRVRYDTPSIAGFTLSTSYTDEDHWDVALRYASEFGGLRVAAAVAFADQNIKEDGNFDQQVNGSISFLHMPTALNLTFAAGQQDDNQDGDITNPHFYYIKLGWTTNTITDLGKTSFAIDYQATYKLRESDDKFHSYALLVRQALRDVGTDLYAGVRMHEAKRGGTRLDDIWGVATGARVKF